MQGCVHACIPLRSLLTALISAFRLGATEDRERERVRGGGVNGEGSMLFISKPIQTNPHHLAASMSYIHRYAIAELVVSYWPSGCEQYESTGSWREDVV